MTQDFYRAFEDRFRGSRAEIKSRLYYYKPILEGLLAEHASPKALDLGCGRGEWLELLNETGFEALGVDTDPNMLAACHARGLNVQQADVLETLRQTPANSLMLVSAFHVVEHLPFDQVLELIEQAHRVLTPGGLLIMETPNSENIGVGTWNFYLDPTHQRPIPHLLLEFATQYGKFKHTQILRLNHDAAVADEFEIGIFDVLCRASPDYAVVGMKAREDGRSLADVFVDCFNNAAGLSLQALSTRYDNKYSSAIRALEADVYAIRAQLDTLARQGSLVSSDGAPQSSEVSRPSSPPKMGLMQLEAELTRCKRELADTKAQLQQIQASTSWRITRPLRLLISRLRRTQQSPGQHDQE